MAAVLICQLALILAALVVGGRLAVRGLRARAVPELLVGTGLMLTFGTLPLLAASGIGRVAAGDIVLTRLATGLAMLCVGQVLLTAFNWWTFRKDRWWAAGLVGAVALIQGVPSVLTVHAISGLPVDADPLVELPGTLLALRASGTLCYGWLTIEALVQYRMAVKRQALGLSERVVVNRFGLWCGIGAVALLNNTLSIVLQALGMGPVRHPVGAAVVAVGGVGAAVLLTLTFTPPASYLRWVGQRATGATI